MSDKTKLTLSVSPEAIAVLEKHTTERKRGEFVSNLLIAYGADAGAISQIDVESMKLQLLGLASNQKTFDGRMMRVERQLAALIADRAK